jgi:hypothetical protein
VEGRDRPTAEGAAKMLTDRLNEHGVGRWIDPVFIAAGTLLVLLLLFVAGGYAVPERGKSGELTTSEVVYVVVALVVLSAVTFGVYKFFAWAFPRLEVFPLGEKSRWQRARKGFFSLIAAFGLGAFFLLAEQFLF